MTATPPARSGSHDSRFLWPLAALAAACLVTLVSFRIFDTDLWQHLVRAKAMLSLHAIPHQEIWTWPIYGTPEKNAAWGFALLLWPFWSLGGVPGLFVWRWLVVLAAFGIAWGIARRLGARGVSALVVMVACAMVFRQRAQPRPETVAVILLGLELWLLETRRQGGTDRTWWIVPIAWIWPNLHVSYYLGWMLLAIFALFEAGPTPRPGKRRLSRTAPPAPDPSTARRAPLLAVLAAAVAISFLNPFGADALRGPIDFLSLRKELLYQGIGELHTIDWSINWQNGLPLLMVAWPALQLWRARQRRGDRIEAIVWLAFTTMAFSSQRFLTFWSVVAAPYLARDLGEWLAARPAPAWARTPGRQAGMAAIVMLAWSGLESTRDAFTLGIGLEPTSIPAAACDFIDKTGVRGRCFNYFDQGGYLLWRFWPQRDRLPFMTTIPEIATPEMRLAYQRASMFEADWRSLDARYRFDYVLLRRLRDPRDHSLDFLDADSTFALVFLDDVSALYLRRDGPMADAARAWRYRWIAGNAATQERMLKPAAADSTLRSGMRGELERSIASSSLHGASSSILASLLIDAGEWDAAERALLEARRVVPATPLMRERLELIARGRAAFTRHP